MDDQRGLFTVIFKGEAEFYVMCDVNKIGYKIMNLKCICSDEEKDVIILIRGSRFAVLNWSW